MARDAEAVPLARALELLLEEDLWRLSATAIACNLPVVGVRRGAIVRMHASFLPSEVHATTFAGTTLRHAHLTTDCLFVYLGSPRERAGLAS